MSDPRDSRFTPLITEAIRRALEEDIGEGDVTTLCTIPPQARSSGHFLAKESGVIAGLEVVRQVYAQLDPRLELEVLFPDGSALEAGTVFARVQGPCQALLMGERTALNFMQRMSGIATQTRRFVQAVAHTKARILDTRKTAPGLRALDKWAVRIGGGVNHRFGLWDEVLIKDNHIAAVGSLREAVRRVREGDPQQRPITVEVRTLEELREALELSPGGRQYSGVSRILLDNMDLEQLRQAVAISAGRVPLEASGNVTLENVAQVAETGVDFISVGALTHSVKALDISLDLES
ncbi:carboxylating nicotinate-nucleotide diphosphorylase [Calidithermus timidus]|jgi:nicotinate-nucleotide pyrophosphorylase (carboxylating)|uniref:carboxylating nicotinate-nucleotide diphosphorylase n=1 Tax=Calidithermus timidus TaxID=307124 RepID=UPI00037BACB9|nr:carboxylating nicotinate-nucleotide diphosphorylase [Calidithermus timidus]